MNCYMFCSILRAFSFEILGKQISPRPFSAVKVTVELLPSVPSAGISGVAKR